MWCWCGCTKSNKSSRKWVIAMTRIDSLLYSNDTYLNSTRDIDWHQNLIEIHQSYQCMYRSLSCTYIYREGLSYKYTYIFVLHLHKFNYRSIYMIKIFCMFWPSPKFTLSPGDPMFNLSTRGGRKWAKLQSRRTAVAMLSSCVGGSRIAPWSIRFAATKTARNGRFFLVGCSMSKHNIHKKIVATPESCRFDVCVVRVKVQSYCLDVMCVFFGNMFDCLD